ncbi:MAG: NEW3 domain-containing protein [Sphaerochaetaceae bacterium]
MKTLKKKSILVFGIVLIVFAPLMASYEGLSISTPYPSLNIENSDSNMIIFNLKVKNYNMTPERVDLSVANLPKGWEYQFIGGGGLVNAVFAEPEDSADVQLWIIPDSKVIAGSYDFSVLAKGEQSSSYSLPLTVFLGQKLPERLQMESELPSVEGTPDSTFSFTIDLQNNSAAETTINLKSVVSDGFSAGFTESYSTDKLSNVTLKAGESKKLKVTVNPPQGVSEGTYPVKVIAATATTSAQAEVTLNIKGQANLTLSGDQGLLSFSAIAGKEKIVTLILKNTGSAEATNIQLSDSSPSNWKAEFSPKAVEKIAPGEQATVKMTVTPSSQAITGDYGLKVSAQSSTSGNISQQFRVTIKTSSLWGIVAVLIIAAGVIILLLVMKKYGRR